MFFEKNSEALLKARPEHRAMIETLKGCSPTQAVELFQTQDGNYSLIYNGVALHNEQLPIEEAQRTLADQCKPGDKRVHLLVGIGLGYLLDEAFRYTQGRLVVYEPDLPLLRFVLDNVDLSEVMASGRVYLTTTRFELFETIRPLLFSTVLTKSPMDVLLLPGYATLMADEIPGLMKQVNTIIDDLLRDFFTSSWFHYQWISQFFNNSPYFAEFNDIGALAGLYEDKPALVISRGPSLDHSLDAIRELAGSVVTIAVGGAIRPMWEAGLIPDFACFYDANGMQEQLNGIPADVLAKITFIMSPSTQECCYTTPSHGKFWFAQKGNDQYNQWLSGVFGKPVKPLRGGGTVSLVAMQSAFMMRCNPIILVGQDLAFTNNMAYAGGIEIKTKDGKLDLDKTDTLYTAPSEMAMVLGQNGEMMPCLHAHPMFVRQFENEAKRNASREKPVKLYNSSIGGAHIEGYELRRLSEFVGELSQWREPFAPLESGVLAGLPEAEKSARKAHLRQALKTLQKETRQAMEQIWKIKRSVKTAKKLTPGIFGTELQRLKLYLQKRPILLMMMTFQILGLMPKIQELTKNADARQLEATQAEFIATMDKMRNSFETMLLPWLESAERKLDGSTAEVAAGEFLAMAEESISA